MPPRHLHNHLRHPLLLTLTNDRRVGKTRHLYWDIWQGHNLSPLQRRSAHTGCFVYHCQAEFRVEISLSQQLTSAPCFLSPRPPLRPSRPSLFCRTIGLTSLNASVMFSQCDAVSKPTSDQSPQDHLRPRGDRGEGPFLEDSAPLRTSEGTSGTTKRTVSSTEDGHFLHTVCNMQHGDTGLPHICAVFNDQLSSCVLQIEVIFLTKKILLYLFNSVNQSRQISRSECSCSCYWNLFSGTFGSDDVVYQHLCLYTIINQPCRDLHNISLTCQLPHLQNKLLKIKQWQGATIWFCKD